MVDNSSVIEPLNPKKMFPLNEKTHGMDMRSKEKYKVQYAKNNRLKNSAIIYMQKIIKWPKLRKQMTEPPMNFDTEGWICVYI